jgi:ribosomal protein L24E
MNRAALLLLFVSGLATAADVRSMDVRFEDGFYTLESTVWFDARLESTYEMFSRWDRSEDFSSFVVEAHDIEPGEDGRPGFYVRNRGCILFFCKSLTREGWVEREHDAILRAVADPERSDFEVSNETWTFTAAEGGTIVTTSTCAPASGCRRPSALT